MQSGTKPTFVVPELSNQENESEASAGGTPRLWLSRLNHAGEPALFKTASHRLAGTIFLLQTAVVVLPSVVPMPEGFLVIDMTVAFPEMPTGFTEFFTPDIRMQGSREPFLEDRFGRSEIPPGGAVLLGFSIPKSYPPLLARGIDGLSPYFLESSARCLGLFIVLGQRDNHRTAAP
jgi:hypothetical protein